MLVTQTYMVTCIVKRSAVSLAVYGIANPRVAGTLA
jgi:hypothetical protein